MVICWLKDGQPEVHDYTAINQQTVTWLGEACPDTMAMLGDNAQ